MKKLFVLSLVLIQVLVSVADAGDGKKRGPGRPPKCECPETTESSAKQARVAEVMCAICQDTAPQESPMQTLFCGHRFHAPCIAQWLLQSQACPSCGVLEPRYNVLHDFAQVGNLAMVLKLIADGIDVNAQDKFGATALHIATGNGHIEIARALLATPGIKVNAITQSGNTALHCTACHCYVDAVTYLYSHARDSSASEMAKLLIGFGANLDIENHDSQTALNLATQIGHTEITHILLNAHRC